MLHSFHVLVLFWSSCLFVYFISVVFICGLWVIGGSGCVVGGRSGLGAWVMVTGVGGVYGWIDRKSR